MPEIHEILKARWSPRDFDPNRLIEPEKLRTLFDAARWAFSSRNEQPWRFMTATRDDADGFGKILAVLAEPNQNWAKNAGLIGFSVGSNRFRHNGAPNRYALHDTGAASLALALEASVLGLEAHFMGGFDHNRARSEFSVPDEFEIGAAFGVGYVAQGIQPPERNRNSVETFVFGPAWGQPAGWTAS